MVLKLYPGDYYKTTVGQITNTSSELYFRTYIKPVCANLSYDQPLNDVLVTFDKNNGRFEIVNFIYCNN